MSEDCKLKRELASLIEERRALEVKVLALKLAMDAGEITMETEGYELARQQLIEEETRIDEQGTDATQRVIQCTLYNLMRGMDDPSYSCTPIE